MSAPKVFNCNAERNESTIPIRKPTSAVTGNACAPLRKILAENSRHGISCGCEKRCRISSTSCPNRLTISRRFLAPENITCPSVITQTKRSLGESSCKPDAPAAERSIISLKASETRTLSGQQPPHARHSTSAPTLSRRVTPLKSHSTFRATESCSFDSNADNGIGKLARVQSPVSSMRGCAIECRISEASRGISVRTP